MELRDQLKNIWRSLLQRAARSPFPALMLLIGLAIGLSFQIRWPLAFTTGAAEITGSALGASITLFGAFWLAGDNHRRKAETARDLVARCVMPALRRIDEVIEASHAMERGEPDAHQRMQKAQNDLADDGQTAHDRIVGQGEVQTLGVEAMSLQQTIAVRCYGLINFRSQRSTGPDLLRGQLNVEKAMIVSLIDRIGRVR